MTKSNHYKSAIITIIVLLIVLPITIQETTASLQHNITSPKNIIYNENEVPLNISIRTTNGKRLGYSNFVTRIFYCLDKKSNVTVPYTVSQTGDQGIQHYNYRASTLLRELSDGDHSVKVYAVDSNNYSFVVDTLDFAVGYSLKTPDPSLLYPIIPLGNILLLIGIIALLGAIVIFWRKK